MNKVADAFFSRFFPTTKNDSSKKLQVAVIGGGPAGLLLTWKLLDAGHTVTVFEKGGEHKLDQEPDPRSYNLTADGLGLRAFGRLANLIYWAGIIVDGRAIHSPSGSLWTHPYGYQTSDHLISIPRGDLLALLTATITSHIRCKLHFNCTIKRTGVDAEQGTVKWKYNNAKVARKKLENLDLIAFADGAGGIGRIIRGNTPGTSSRRNSHPTAYLNLTISEDVVRKANLDLSKIHFFPAPDNKSLGIGLPNFDGSISLLLEGEIQERNNNEEVCPFTGQVPFRWNSSVFTTKKAADQYLKTQHPTLGKVLNNFFDQVRGRLPGHFIESYINKWRVGTKGILVGDAGSCAPPWAGFGMNLACSHAADLAVLLSHHTTVRTALIEYNKRRVACTRVVKNIIEDHGDLLNSGIGSQNWCRKQAIRERKEQVLGERSDYQIVAFEEQGLEILAGLE